jgi:cyclopropane-fatty-acyl-phospholipid synthase
MFIPGTTLSLGEAYIYDDFDVMGPIEPIFALRDGLEKRLPSRLSRLALLPKLLRLPSTKSLRATERGRAQMAGEAHSVERDGAAIRYHYDVSNDFYQIFLDERMVYSCAYFESPEDDLNTAQARKLDYICRKLRLKPGQRVLDIGCGWGGLLIHAAKEYGVDATGITLSEPQVELATERIAKAGLGARCRVLLQDYRETKADPPYDVLVSVGMFEHVGEALLPTYFEKAMALLRPKGVFLNHGIARREGEAAEDPRSFSRVYVFPDGELVPISTSLRAAEQAGFEVRDVESLREHYTLTLRHWVRRLEACHEGAVCHVDEPTYRVWRLYMSGSAHAFATGRMNLYQSLMVKQGPQGGSDLPLLRSDWYA